MYWATLILFRFVGAETRERSGRGNRHWTSWTVVWCCHITPVLPPGLYAGKKNQTRYSGRRRNYRTGAAWSVFGGPGWCMTRAAGRRWTSEMGMPVSRPKSSLDPICGGGSGRTRAPIVGAVLVVFVCGICQLHKIRMRIFPVNFRSAEKTN